MPSVAKATASSSSLARSRFAIFVFLRRDLIAKDQNKLLEINL
jgi:hypothetical protein